VQFLITSNVPFSSLVMVAIAVDRYICICHPLRQATLATGHRARIVVVFLALFAMALGICVALMFGVNHRMDVPPRNASFPTATGYDRPAMNDATAMTSYQYETAVAFSSVAIVSGLGELSQRHPRREGVSIATPRSVGDDCVIGTRPCASVARAYEVIDYSDSWPIINTGYCGANNLVLGTGFDVYYVVLHSAMYPLCFAAVVVLYALIYRSVLVRRARRQRLRSPASPVPPPVVALDGRRTAVSLWTRASMSVTGLCTRATYSRSSVGVPRQNGPQSIGNSVDGVAMVLIDAPVKGETANAKRHLQASTSRNDIELAASSRENVEHVIEISKNENSEEATVTRQLYGQQAASRDARGGNVWTGGGRSTDPHRTLLAANLRTAAMLFVVTVVFVVCYTPAFLMSVEIVEYQIVLFYMYFINSVANPVVYSFMNRYFRQELRTILCRPIESHYRRSHL